MDNSTTYQSSVRLHDISLGIVCPMANECDTAVEFVNAVLDQCKGFNRVIFFAVLDNASKDGTIELLKKLQNQRLELNVFWSPENRCVVDAYVRGYREACNAGCDWILEIDAGFSHQPSDIRQFFDKMLQGYDCVFGSRFCKGGKFTDAPLGRYLISRWGSIAANLLLGTKLKDMTSGFEIFSNAALQKILDKGIRSRGHFFQTEVKAYCRNLRITEVPICYSKPSKHVNTTTLVDAFHHLFLLFCDRLSGNL